MCLLHKWVDVPLDDKIGFLRKCTKCGQRQAKGWVTIKLPYLKFIRPSGWVGLFNSQGHEIAGGFHSAVFLFEFRVKRLIFKWKKWES